MSANYLIEFYESIGGYPFGRPGSWIRPAASAYRATRVLVSAAELQTVLAREGEVMYSREGDCFRLFSHDDLIRGNR